MQDPRWQKNLLKIGGRMTCPSLATWLSKSSAMICLEEGKLRNKSICKGNCIISRGSEEFKIYYSFPCLARDVICDSNLCHAAKLHCTNLDGFAAFCFAI